MTAKRTNPDFLNGVPELLILQLLDRRPQYGYELVKAIRTSSGEAFAFGEGCVYPLLHRLEAEGLLVSEQRKVGNRTRFVYSTTAAGRARLADSRAVWEQVATGIRAVLQGGAHERPAVV
ncbi:MAG: helix-turn-helix transcriptional regulator [Pirellulaceae bacterium]|nr:helix-turn-helix transcriptional regulator [Pirellulaceae bacterium]